MVAYSGVYEDASGRRSLANKVSYASFEPARNFRSHAEGVVADFYAVGSVKRRIFNSDGGLWLQRNMVPGCTYQLDPFHRNKAVRTYVDDPELQETILGLLRAHKAKDAIAVVEASIESTLDPVEQEKRRKLYPYFSNNRHSLVPYYQRPGRKPPQPNEGQQAARCGSMERNIFTIIGNRMKHNRTCWSVAGANNLAALCWPCTARANCGPSCGAGRRWVSQRRLHRDCALLCGCDEQARGRRLCPSAHALF